MLIRAWARWSAEGCAARCATVAPHGSSQLVISDARRHSCIARFGVPVLACVRCASPHAQLLLAIDVRNPCSKLTCATPACMAMCRRDDVPAVGAAPGDAPHVAGAGGQPTGGLACNSVMPRGLSTAALLQPLHAHVSRWLAGTQQAGSVAVRCTPSELRETNTWAESTSKASMPPGYLLFFFLTSCLECCCRSCGRRGSGPSSSAASTLPRRRSARRRPRSWRRRGRSTQHCSRRWALAFYKTIWNMPCP